MKTTATPNKSESISSVQFLKGIGPQKARALNKLGYSTLKDLFFLFPRRYEDRSKFKTIKELKEGETATIKGRITSSSVRYFKGRGHFQMSVKDDSGVISATWFNQPYLKKNFEKGEEVILYGKIGKFGRLQISNPDYEKVDENEDVNIHSGRITPIYPLVSGLYQRGLRRSLWVLLEEHSGLIEEYMPPRILEALKPLEIKQALSEIHFPSSWKTLERARNRLIFDEFFLFETRLLRRLYRFKRERSLFPFQDLDRTLDVYTASLPFKLTVSQKNALKEISGDIHNNVPMTRLLQGDVGSGKTVVAAGLFQAAAENGYQAVFLAPTETLAEQHYNTIKTLLSDDTKSELALLTGSLKDKEKSLIRAKLKKGSLRLAVGTHALIQEDVVFDKLGLAVIDEQHKFGVEQRSKLMRGNQKPHVLLMTATPIPRTLAMTLYGDLDCTTLNELPSGRKPIQTSWIQKKSETAVFEDIRNRLNRKEQGFFVYPAIEETDKSCRVSCEQDFPRIQKLLSGYKIELIHGQLNSDERIKIMNRFKSGEIDALVATTVIEVGIDNPNATFVCIYGAEYFGLSQLHQIRGRVGRGSRPSACYLFGSPATEEAVQRFKVMTETQDGFILSEEDLKLRGPGDFLGTRQSGLPLFKLANILTDQRILDLARKHAHSILDEDIELDQEDNIKLKERLEDYGRQFSEL